MAVTANFAQTPNLGRARISGAGAANTARDGSGVEVSTIFLKGIALEDAALRLNNLCVSNSACINLGYVNTNVVILFPLGSIESATIFEDIFLLFSIFPNYISGNIYNFYS